MASNRIRGRTVRLSAKLLQDAAVQGEAWNRSTAQQIEFWASIGQVIAAFLSPKDIVAIGQGLARIKVEPVSPTRSTSMPSDEIAPTNDCRLRDTQVALSHVSPKDIRELLGLGFHPAVLESDMDVVDLLEGGLPRMCIDTLIDRTGFTSAEISRVIRVTEKTLRRWRSGAENDQLLTSSQSSQLWILGGVFKQAQYALGTERLALIWLRESQVGISGRKPLELLSTYVGIGVVCDFLSQIDSGVYI